MRQFFCRLIWELRKPVVVFLIDFDNLKSWVQVMIRLCSKKGDDFLQYRWLAETKYVKNWVFLRMSHYRGLTQKRSWESSAATLSQIEISSYFRTFASRYSEFGSFWSQNTRCLERALSLIAKFWSFEQLYEVESALKLCIRSLWWFSSNIEVLALLTSVGYIELWGQKKASNTCTTV